MRMATKKFSSLFAYYDYVDKQLKFCMNEIFIQLKNEMKDYLFQNWYKKYTPTQYNRTFNLLDSITFKLEKQGNASYVVKVGYDTDLIHAEYDEYSFFNQHMSMGGEDVSDIVPYYIEKGNGKNPYFMYKGIGVLEYMREYMEERATAKLAFLLHQKGITIK